MIKDNGHCFIPVDLSSFSKEINQQFNLQIKSPTETRIYATNFECMHVFNIKAVEESNYEFYIKNSKFIHKNYKKLKDKKKLTWLRVNDLFIVHVDHFLSDSISFEEAFLSKFRPYSLDESCTNVIERENLDGIKPTFINDFTTKSYFQSIKKQEIKNCTDSILNLKWVETNRSLTVNYYYKSCFLRDSIYQGGWNFLEKATHFFLIECEKEKVLAANADLPEKLIFLKKAFEYYLSAVLSELENHYLKPFFDLLKNNSFLKTTLHEGSGKDLFIFKMNHGERNLLEMIKFFENAKSDIFTLKRKVQKSVINEEKMTIDKVICEQEKRIDNFYRRNSMEILNQLMTLRNWFAEELSESVGTGEAQELIIWANKINEILSRLTSSHYQDNSILQICHLLHGKLIGDKSIGELFSLFNDSASVNSPFKLKLAK
jgi:hypothetical protein